MGHIKAIETSYKGYRFRSRLEARWAVFFDAVGVRWEYEKQGYDLAGTPYLPDFYLPAMPLWVEVKAKERETRDDWELCRRLCAATREPVMMAFADLCPLGFTENNDIVGSNRGWRWVQDERGERVVFDDGCWEFAQCPTCGKIGAACHGQHELCECHCDPAWWIDKTFRSPVGSAVRQHCAACGVSRCTWNEGSHRTWQQGGSRRLRAAYQAARSARFEHGETPQVRPPSPPAAKRAETVPSPVCGCGGTGVLFLGDPQGRNPEWCPCDLSGQFGTGMNSEVLREWLKRHADRQAGRLDELFRD